jgi:hypothetical protein
MKYMFAMLDTSFYSLRFTLPDSLSALIMRETPTDRLYTQTECQQRTFRHPGDFKFVGKMDNTRVRTGTMRTAGTATTAGVLNGIHTGMRL